MSRHTEASALNVTVAELKAVVARQAQDLVGLTETSDGKNAALIAAAKKTVGLQEKLAQAKEKLAKERANTLRRSGKREGKATGAVRKQKLRQSYQKESQHAAMVLDGRG